MKLKPHLYLVVFLILFVNNNSFGTEPESKVAYVDIETRTSLFLIGNLISIYDGLDEESKTKTDNKAYIILFTYYVNFKYLNGIRNKLLEPGLGELHSIVKDSESFRKFVDNPNRFYPDQINFKPNIISFRMNDKTFTEIEIKSEIEFKELNAGFKIFLQNLETSK